MTIFEAAASLLIEILRAFVSRQLAEELKAWTPWVIERIIRSAVSILPESERERFEEEWRSHINEVPGQLGKLCDACSLLLGARKMRDSLMARHIPTYKDCLKRTFDITVSGLMIMLQFPVLLLIALALRLTGSGEVLRRDVRVGLNGQKFFRYAFCMRSGVLGNLLQRTSLDELPQLFNVLRGDMAMIGPHAQIFRSVAHPTEAIPRPAELNVKPGLAGWQFARKRDCERNARKP